MRDSTCMTSIIELNGLLLESVNDIMHQSNYVISGLHIVQ